MKRFISILCALTLIASFATITANAEKKGVTELKLNEGDKVDVLIKESYVYDLYGELKS